MKEKIKNHIFKNKTYLIIIIIVLLLFVLDLIIFKHTLRSENTIKSPYNLTIKTTDNFVFLGDSITEGYPLEELYDGIPVINSGISGNQTTDILNDMKNRVYIYNPTKVFLLIGTNNLVTEESKKNIVKDIKKIVTKIKKEKPECKIYIESIYPINNSNDQKIDKVTVNIRSNKDIKIINKQIKKYCINTNNVNYIDVYSELVDTEGNLALKYTKEGLHLTDLGYLKVTKILLPYLSD